MPNNSDNFDNIFESIFSPATAGTAAAESALVIRRRELDTEIKNWQLQRRRELETINNLRLRVQQEQAVVQQQQADNWLEAQRLQGDRSDIQHELSIVRRDKDLISKREKELEHLEDQRRRNRTLSTAYLEDSFSSLSPRDVVENLTHSSLRIRKHAMDNISFCINGSINTAPTIVRFQAEDIAPYLLPKLHQLLSASNKPISSVVQFAEEIVSSPHMAKALALCGQCQLLADFLIESNGFVNGLAICSLRQMVKMETSVVKVAYEALSTAVPLISVPDSDTSITPVVAFVEEVGPKIIDDCFHNGLWSAISSLVTHRVDSIRRVVLPKIVLEAQLSDRTRHGLVEANTLGLLDPQYHLSSPPSDVIDFFVKLLPLLADRICQRTDCFQWLLRRLGDPNPLINIAVVEALRTCSMKQDVTMQDIFVNAKLLQRLDEPPTQPSSSITKLICELLPVLAIPHARLNKVSCIINFLDHADVAVSNACHVACMRIVDSTVENRVHLYSTFTKLNFGKESVLKLCDYAMPAIFKDWAAAGDFSQIAGFLFHGEWRIRAASHRAWDAVVSKTPSARTEIVHDGLLNVVFELCSSPYEDCVVLGCQTLSHMAIEIAKVGTGPTRQLVNLLNHPRLELRRAVLRSIQVISQSTDSNCDLLLAADAFNALKMSLQTNPHDDPDTAHQILVRLSPFLSKSSDACSGLLELLDSKAPQVESATRSALARISCTNIEDREMLRRVMLDRRVLASDTLIEVTAQAIHDWIGPDLAQLNDFVTLFDLASDSNKHIQTAALHSLKQRISNPFYQESLERADVDFFIRSIASSNNPEAIAFVAFALPSLALNLSSNGHLSTILGLLTCEEPQIREGASAAIEAIANGSSNERQHLVDEDVLERLIGSSHLLGQTELQISSIIVQKLAFDYLHSGKINLILTLVDHQQQQLRIAATKSVATIVGGTANERSTLRHTLLPLLNGATPLLREVASDCLSRSLAHDLVSDRDYIQLFRLLEDEDVRIRAPAIAEFSHHIEASDETIRGRIVDANILPVILKAAAPDKDDVISFTTNCVLPVLGPSFSRNSGAKSLLPLLHHGEPRIRTAAATAIRNAVDSRHGSIQNVANSGIVSALHAMIDDDNRLRDLWCHVTPKAAPFLSVRAEIDMLFGCLADGRDVVRETAAEAISTMAKTSEDTRCHLFPALMHRLDAPSGHELELVAQAVSLSGSTFLSNGKEYELMYLILHGHPSLVAAAVDAITQLLSKGSSYEHMRLLDANVVPIAMQVYENPSQRQLSLKLLHNIIPHLSHAIILNETSAEWLFSLFDDPDPDLSHTLYQTLTSDPRVLENMSRFPNLLSLLLNQNRLHSQFVSSFLRRLAPDMVPHLVLLKREDIIVKALMAKDTAVSAAYLQETRANLNVATEEEKDILADEPQFVTALGNFLKSSDAALRRISSEIIEVLSRHSPSRSEILMAEGIGSSLAWVSVNGAKAAQHPSIVALSTLFMAAPDRADQLVADSLPALREIMMDVHRPLEVYCSSLSFLEMIVKKSSHATIIESDIIPCLIGWLSPQHSIANLECRTHIFEICHMIAQNSDPGRKVLIDRGILSVLSRLAVDRSPINVINACKMLKALAHTGTYREELISAKVKDVMQNITSLLHRSSLESKSDRKQAQDAANQVLQALKATKHVGAIGVNTVPNVVVPAMSNNLQRSRSEVLPPGHQPPSRLSTTSSAAHVSNRNPRIPTRWSVQEFAGGSDIADIMDPDTAVLPNHNQSPASMSLRHARRATDPGARTLTAHLSRVSEALEERSDIEPSETIIAQQYGDISNNMGARTNRNSSLSTRPRLVGQSSGLHPGAGLGQAGISLGQGVLPPPSYRTAPSISGNSSNLG